MTVRKRISRVPPFPCVLLADLVFRELLTALEKEGGDVLGEKVSLRLSAIYDPLAQAADALGDAATALRWHQAAMRGAAPVAWFHTNFANFLFRHGNRTEAMELHAQAVHIEPNSAIAWHNYGFAAEQIGKTALALQAYEKAARLLPHHKQIRANLYNLRARLHRQGAVRRSVAT